MDLNELADLAQMGGIGLVIILAGLIRIPKMEINFWTYLGRMIGRTLNGEVVEKVDHLSTELESHILQDAEKNARSARRRFLRFSDELADGQVTHSKEHFEEVLDEIDRYRKYCADHPEFENSKSEVSIQNIKDTYAQKLKNHEF